jgi:hypothetical protein
MLQALERGPVAVAVVVMLLKDRPAVWVAQVRLGKVEDDPGTYMEDLGLHPRSPSTHARQQDPLSIRSDRLQHWASIV